MVRPFSFYVAGCRPPAKPLKGQDAQEHLRHLMEDNTWSMREKLSRQTACVYESYQFLLGLKTQPDNTCKWHGLVDLPARHAVAAVHPYPREVVRVPVRRGELQELRALFEDRVECPKHWWVRAGRKRSRRPKTMLTDRCYLDGVGGLF